MTHSPDSVPNRQPEELDNDSPVLTEQEVARMNEANRQTQSAAQQVDEKWEEFRDGAESGTPDSPEDWKEVERKVEKATKP